MKHQQVVVSKIIKNTSDVSTIYFVSGQTLDYEPGQYISVFFDDTNVPQGKAYSFSSCPSDKEMSITVKKIGLFSGKLHSLRAGDRLAVSSQYGSFNAYKTRPAVMIAAGVGIAPIWSIIKSEHFKKTNRAIKLFYTNKNVESVIFKSQIDKVAQENTEFENKYFLTQSSRSDYVCRRIDPKLDLIEYVGTHCFYICGSADFVRSIWRQLKLIGVSDQDVSTETFFGADDYAS